MGIDDRIVDAVVEDLLHLLKPAVHQAVEASLTLERDQIGGFSPWLDLAGMTHAQQQSRLFLS